MKSSYFSLDRKHLLEIIRKKEEEIKKLNILVYELSKEISPLREQIKLIKQIANGR